MKRLNNILTIALILFLWSACKKEELVLSGSSWVKVLETGNEYFGSNVVQLADGNLLVLSIGKEDPTTSNTYGSVPALLMKLDQQGDKIWTKELPESVYAVWGFIALNNGNIAVYGLNSEVNSEQVGIVVLSPQGELLHEYSFFNQTVSSLAFGVFSSVHAIQSSDGRIRMVVPKVCCGSSLSPPIMPRLLAFDTELNVLSDELYETGGLIPITRVFQMTLMEDDAQNLYLQGGTEGYWINYFAWQLKLSADNEEVEFYHNYSTHTGDIIPSRSTMSHDKNALVWAHAETELSDTLWTNVLNLRSQEVFTRGPVISFWKTHEDSTLDIRKNFSGFPKNAVITKVKQVPEGGYIAVGTCNINDDQNIPSDYRILLIKLTENLDVEWVQYPNTDSQAVGTDVIYTSNGYIVLGTYFSLGENTYPLILKTNLNGNF